MKYIYSFYFFTLSATLSHASDMPKKDLEQPRSPSSLKVTIKNTITSDMTTYKGKELPSFMSSISPSFFSFQVAGKEIKTGEHITIEPSSETLELGYTCIFSKFGITYHKEEKTVTFNIPKSLCSKSLSVAFSWDNVNRLSIPELEFHHNNPGEKEKNMQPMLQ